jgi:hypothetical protein
MHENSLSPPFPVVAQLGIGISATPALMALPSRHALFDENGTCLRLMGKKMLVALMMEGKFSGEGLQALDTDEDLMSAIAAFP